MLLWIRLASIIVEKSITKLGPEVKQRVRAKNYLVSSSLVFVLDLCLIAPIILMVVRPKAVAFGLIPAIAEATYCLYKIVAAIISYRRSKRSQNPTIVLQKEISIIGAIVSVLMLQHTLIEVTGGMNPEMQSLSLATSIGFIALIVAFSIVAFVKNKRIFKLASTSSQH